MRQFVALVPLLQRCDNGAAVHQVDNGAAADRLRVVQILDVLQLLRVVPTWDNSRAYRVTKCCSAGGVRLILQA